MLQRFASNMPANLCEIMFDICIWLIQIFNKYDWVYPELCLCIGYDLDMPDSWTKIRLGCVLDMSKMPDIYMIYGWDMVGICLRYAR